ncbi:unnamed protein product, partial [Mycena citricolor]
LRRETRARHAAAGLAASDVAAGSREGSSGEEERDEGRGKDHCELERERTWIGPWMSCSQLAAFYLLAFNVRTQ